MCVCVSARFLRELSPFVSTVSVFTSQSVLLRTSVEYLEVEALGHGVAMATCRLATPLKLCRTYDAPQKAG